MWTYWCGKMKWWLVPAVVLTVSGCAPGPLPPVFPSLVGFGLGWLAVGLLVWIGFLVWKKHGSADPLKTDYLAEALNAVNRRLSALEEKIEELRKGQKEERK